MELRKENAKLLNFTVAGGIAKCFSSIITYPQDKNIRNSIKFGHPTWFDQTIIVLTGRTQRDGQIWLVISVKLKQNHFSDVVRTLLQEEKKGGKKGFFNVLSAVYKENGYKSLYRGFSLQVNTRIHIKTAY